MREFPWREHLNVNTDTNWQVKTFTDIFLNMTNFITNGTKRIVARDPPIEAKDMLDTFRLECQQAVGTAKMTYLKNSGNKVNGPSTTQKSYWKIIN